MPDIEIELFPSRGGVFEVTREGQVVYTKARTHRFPNPGEVTAMLKA